MAKKLGLRHYIKEAFNAKPKVKGLGEVPVNWLALLGVGALGLLNPGFLLLGAAAEISYLTALSHNPRFRKYVEGKGLVQAQQTWQEQKQAIVETLSYDAQNRYAAFEARTARAHTLQENTSSGGFLETVASEGIEQLHWIYLKLLASKEILAKQIIQVPPETIEQEILENQERLAALGEEGDTRLRTSIQSTLELLQKRLANLEGTRTKLEFIDSELRRIEHQAELIIEEATLSRDPSILSSRIDAVTSTFGETQTWLEENRDLFGEVEEEISVPPLQTT